MDVIHWAAIGLASTLKSINKEYNNCTNRNSNPGVDVISKFVKNHDINSQIEMIIKNSELKNQNHCFNVKYSIIHITYLKW